MTTRNLVVNLANVAGARPDGAVLTITAPPITDLGGDTLSVGPVRRPITGSRLTVPLVVSGAGDTNPAEWQYKFLLTWIGGSLPEFSAPVEAGAGDLAFTDLMPTDPTDPVYLPATIDMGHVAGLDDTLDGIVSSLGFPPGVDASTLAGAFDPATSVYNGTGAPLRAARAALMRVANGTPNKMHMVCVADSLAIGYDGTTTVEADSFPRRLAGHLATRTGLPMGGTGLTPAAVAAGTNTDRWTSTGTADRTLYPGFLTMFAGSTATYASVVAGTAVDVYYSNLSAPFTFKVGAGAVQNVTPDGTATIGRVGVTGLASGAQTVVVTAASNYVFVSAVEVKAPTGIVMHNMAFGGSTADIGGPNMAWLDASSHTSINGAMKGTLDASGVVPDLFIISLGANDILQGDTTSHAIDGVRRLRAWYPAASVILVSSWSNPVTPPGVWAQYVQAKYALADEVGAVLVDFQHKTGTQAQAEAAGLLAADRTHALKGVQVIWGQALANLVAG